jgi:hypothetical protein
MGLAWYQILAQRHWLRALGLYATSIGLHGLWNSLTVGISLISFQALDAGVTNGDQSLAGLAILGILAILVILALAITLGLAALTRHIGRQGATIGIAKMQPMQPTPNALPAKMAVLDRDQPTAPKRRERRQ